MRKIGDKCIYIHRIDNNTVMNPNVLVYHIQLARAADVIMELLDEPYAPNAYLKQMQGFLLTFCKNWYLIWTYHNRDRILLNEMETLLNKIFFCTIVCKLWFTEIVKIKFHLWSRG